MSQREPKTNRNVVVVLAYDEERNAYAVLTNRRRADLEATREAIRAVGWTPGGTAKLTIRGELLKALGRTEDAGGGERSG